MTKPRAYARLISELPPYSGTYTGDPNARYVWVDEGGLPIIARELGNYDTSKRVEWKPSLKTTGQTQLESADKREVDKRNADEYASQYSVGNILGGLATPLNFTSPTQQIGAISDVLQGKKGYWESIGGGNSGIVTDNFQQNYPIWSAIINATGDITLPYAGYKTFTNVVRPTLVSYQINKMPLNKTQLTEIPSNVGWGPRQTLSSIVHKSDKASPLALYNENKWDVAEFVPSYVHKSNASDLAKPGKLTDEFYNHTFNVDVGDVARYSEISDYIVPIEKDVGTLNRELYKDILQDNVNKGLLSKQSAYNYYSIFNRARNNMKNYSSFPKEYQDDVVKSLDSNVVDRYHISGDGRIWGTFKVGDRWKGVTRPLQDGSSIQYITDARNSPATIAIHEGGHGIQTSVGQRASGINLNNFIGNDLERIDFIEGLNNSELNFFKAQPPSVQELLYTNQNLFKNVPIREVTNVARDIRAMLTTKGIKTKDQLYKYIEGVSDDELYNMYPQTNYLKVMKENAQQKKDYTDFLKKLIVGTAFSVPVVTSVNQTE